jgi:CheY-like chemotaxis protein
MKTEDTTPYRVLIVDDFEDNRAMYAEFLRYSGFDVIEGTNGVEAIEFALTHAPDAIVMDLSLPVLDGWEATRRLKGDPRTRDIPVIALTGHALEGHSRGARDAGCDCFLSKPCLPEALVQTLTDLLANRVPHPRSPSGATSGATGAGPRARNRL